MDNTVFFTPTPADAFAQAGLPFTDVDASRNSRFSTNDDKSDKSGFYRPFSDGLGAAFGCWRSGVSYVWQLRIDGAPKPTSDELKQAKAQAAQARKQAEAERAELHAQVAKLQAVVHAGLPAATADNPYLKRKKVSPFGDVRQGGDEQLFIPVYDGDGLLQSTQQIFPDGRKQFAKDAKMQGGRFVFGALADGATITLAEGYSTSASLYHSGIGAVVCCFFGSNLAAVAADLRKQYPKSFIRVAGDIDPNGAGEKFARAATAIPNCAMVFPAFADGRTKGDFNDLHQFAGLNAVRSQCDRVGRPASDSNNSARGEPMDEDIFSLDAFVMNGTAKEMESKMLEDKFVLGRLAILGQSTLWYAPPNVGKTLLFLWLLIDAIKRGEIDPENVYFIDADDHHKGLISKLRLAELHKFKLLAPSYNGFKPEKLAMILSAIVLQDKAHGKILILDTAKKFTDIMDKKKGSAFGESVRQFVMHGGTVISLAHTNKHRDDSGGLIYSGTSDLVDDCDAAYTLDEVSANLKTGIKTVKFSNFKARGDNALEAVYEYNFGEGLSYQRRLDSVRSLSHAETDAAVKRKAVEDRLERNREAVDAIQQCIKNGVTKKTELIKAAMDLSALAKSKVATALKEHTGKLVADGHFWHVDIADKNAHVYHLNVGM